MLPLLLRAASNGTHPWLCQSARPAVSFAGLVLCRAWRRLCAKGGFSLQVSERKAAETTAFRWAFVCLFVWKLPKPQSLFLEGGSGSGGGGKLEGRHKVRAGCGRGLPGGDGKPRKSQTSQERARPPARTRPPAARSCRRGDGARRPALQEQVPGGEGRGEMRSGRYWWVEWVPGGRSHPRVQFYISQRER